MTLVTKSNDIALWTILSNKWDGEAGWIIYTGKHYEVKFSPDGFITFLLHETLDMMDSRSLKPGYAASYKELDRGDN